MSLQRFMSLFVGRRDCYGLQKFCMKEALTEDSFKEHIEGKKRIGVYPLHNGTENGPGQMCSWIAADIDDKDFNKAVSIKRYLYDLGIESYIERSKSKGYHVFCFFDQQIEAWKLRVIWMMMLEKLGFKCELFPKQDESTETGYGNFINLPLFGGDISEHKTIFIDEKEEPFVSSVDEIENLTVNSISIINTIITDNDYKRTSYSVEQVNIENEAAKMGNIKTPPCIDKILANGVKKGQRNEATFRLAVYYKEKGIKATEAVKIITEWNKKNTESTTPLQRQLQEIKSAVESVWRGDYKAFKCEEGSCAEYCIKAECPIVGYAERKKDIAQGIITLTFRDKEVMVFKQYDYEFRVTNIMFAGKKSRKFKCSVTLSKKDKMLTREVVDLELGIHRKKFIKVAGDESLDESLIKLYDLIGQKIEEEQKEELLRPKQLYIMTEPEKAAALDFLNSTPDLLAKVMEVTNRMGVVGEEVLRLMAYLCFTSRITKNPISIVVKGESSSGKSFSCQNVMKLIPEEGRRFMTRATAQALYHMQEDELQNRIIYINELPGSESADYSIRSAQSEGDLVLCLPIKDPLTGDMTTTEKRVKGPVGFLVTTTKADIFDENETRNFSVFSDDSPELTRKIGDITIRKAMGEEFEISDDELTLWKNIQRLLNADYKVIIPYSEDVFSRFPDKPVRIRRDRERFKELIGVITLLHQYHREKKEKKDGKTELMSTLADYHIAQCIAGKIMTYTIYELSPSAEDIWDHIQKMQLDFEEDPENHHKKEQFTFTYKDVSAYIGWKNEKVKKWIISLIRAGLIDYADHSPGGKGKKAVFKITEHGKTFKPESLGFLPRVKDLIEKHPCDAELFYDPFNGVEVDIQAERQPSVEEALLGGVE